MALVFQPGERVFDFGPVKVIVKVSGSENGGVFELYEFQHQPGAPGPALHRHPTADEAFTVLEGRYTFTVGDETREEAAGSVVRVPRDTPHRFQPDAGAPSRLLALFEPALGFDRYLEGVEALLKESNPPDPARLHELMMKFGQVPV